MEIVDGAGEISLVKYYFFRYNNSKICMFRTLCNDREVYVVKESPND